MELPQNWHYQLITFGIEIAAVVALTGTLAPGSRPRRIFARFAVFYTAVLPMFFAGARSASWIAVAGWFRQLPLT